MNYAMLIRVVLKRLHKQRLYLINIKYIYDIIFFVNSIQNNDNSYVIAYKILNYLKV